MSSNRSSVKNVSTKHATGLKKVDMRDVFHFEALLLQLYPQAYLLLFTAAWRQGQWLDPMELGLIRYINIHPWLRGFMVKLEYYFVWKSSFRLVRQIAELSREI